MYVYVNVHIASVGVNVCVFLLVCVRTYACFRVFMTVCEMEKERERETEMGGEGREIGTGTGVAWETSALPVLLTQSFPR